MRLKGIHLIHIMILADNNNWKHYLQPLPWTSRAHLECFDIIPNSLLFEKKPYHLQHLHTTIINGISNIHC